MKNQNKFKLTPDVHKQIKEVSKKIGPFHRRDKNGNLMYRGITKFVEKKTNDKGQIANVYENVKEPILINHEVNLVDIYQKDGQPGIDVYVKFFDDLKKEEQEKASKLTVAK